ncbi:MAG: hypothetical protein M3439_13415, partial [Chloroflexota bacterium]|nr:hypothetical protein [Chloroflexota bacterium]
MSVARRWLARRVSPADLALRKAGHRRIDALNITQASTISVSLPRAGPARTVVLLEPAPVVSAPISIAPQRPSVDDDDSPRHNRRRSGPRSGSERDDEQDDIV